METTVLGSIEKTATIIGILAAAGFFAWKLIAGWLIANLDVSLEAQRQIKDAADDWLVIKLVLKKGNIDAIWIKDVALKIYNSQNGEVYQIVHIDEFNSITVNNDKIELETPLKGGRKYSIATNETFQYGRIVTVPAEQPLIIEAAVFGKRIGWKAGPQWRSSLGSLPISDRKPPQGRR